MTLYYGMTTLRDARNATPEGYSTQTLSYFITSTTLLVLPVMITSSYFWRLEMTLAIVHLLHGTTAIVEVWLMFAAVAAATQGAGRRVLSRFLDFSGFSVNPLNALLNRCNIGVI